MGWGIPYLYQQKICEVTVNCTLLIENDYQYAENKLPNIVCVYESIHIKHQVHKRILRGVINEIIINIGIVQGNGNLW